MVTFIRRRFYEINSKACFVAFHSWVLTFQILDVLDGICYGTSIVTPAHLDYQDDADSGAEWVADYLGY